MATSPCGLAVVGSWTKAGCGSCIHVKGKELSSFFNILFDCGILDDHSCYNAKHVFISHGHTDHIGACISHARANALTGSIPTYYIPVECAGPLESARAAFSLLDGKDIPMNIVPMKVGEFVTIYNSKLLIKVKAFATTHRVPSQGYAVYSEPNQHQQSKNKRKEDGKGADRRGRESKLPTHHQTEEETEKEVEEKTTPIETESLGQLELVYTGDTTIEALLHPSFYPYLLAPIFILEMTYLDGPYERAYERGHIHLRDVVENQRLFMAYETHHHHQYQHNHQHQQQQRYHEPPHPQQQWLYFVHFSQRYSYSSVLHHLSSSLPECISRKTAVCLKSFGSAGHWNPVLTSPPRLSHLSHHPHSPPSSPRGKGGRGGGGGGEGGGQSGGHGGGGGGRGGGGRGGGVGERGGGFEGRRNININDHHPSSLSSVESQIREASSLIPGFGWSDHPPPSSSFRPPSFPPFPPSSSSPVVVPSPSPPPSLSPPHPPPPLSSSANVCPDSQSVQRYMNQYNQMQQHQQRRPHH